MNDLEKYFRNNNSNMINKWEHYFDIYDRYFSKYRGTDVVFVEIGIFQGGSLKMWKEYFGPKAKIYGIDINPECKKFEDDQIEILIGDQSDKNFLEDLKKNIPKVDILLDDGGHTMAQQINTFEVLYKHIKYGGMFLCEDTHTSYWWRYGGGYKRNNTFIEFSKNLIDYMHAWHSETKKLEVTQLTRTIHAIHFYDSIVIIEKEKILEPKAIQTGKKIISEYQPNYSLIFRLKRSAINKLRNII